MQRRAVLAEQPAELGERLEVTAVGEAATPRARRARAATSPHSAGSTAASAAAGQVPGSPVGLVVQGLGELTVRRGTLRERRGVVDGGTDQGMGEAQTGPVYLDQAQLLGRRQGLRAWSGNSGGCRAQVRAVGHRGQQQRGPRWLGQGGEPGGQDGGQPVGQGQRLGGPPAAGRGIVGDHLGQLDQSHGITGRLGEHLRPGPPAGRPRLHVEQKAGVGRGQRPEMQLGKTAVKAGRRGLPPGAHQQHHPLGVQAAAGEGQRVQRAAVQPVGVVGDHEDRGPFGQIRQQGQHGHPGQQRVRSTGVRGKTERPQQRLGLPGGQTGSAGQHRPQELMQPGEREFRLRFPAGDRQHPHARRPGPVGGVRQQHGLAHPRLAGDQQDLAGQRDRIHQCAQPGQPGFPADDTCELSFGRVTRAWHAPVLSASTFVNAVPHQNSDRGPSMPATRKVQSDGGYRPCRPGATVKTGPGVTTASTGR